MKLHKRMVMAGVEVAMIKYVKIRIHRYNFYFHLNFLYFGRCCSHLIVNQMAAYRLLSLRPKPEICGRFFPSSHYRCDGTCRQSCSLAHQKECPRAACPYPDTQPGETRVYALFWRTRFWLEPRQGAIGPPRPRWRGASVAPRRGACGTALVTSGAGANQDEPHRRFGTVAGGLFGTGDGAADHFGKCHRILRPQCRMAHRNR